MRLLHSPTATARANLARPRHARLDLTSTLVDLATVWCAAEAAPLRAMLPLGLEPLELLGDGPPRALVALGSARHLDWRLGAAPPLPARFVLLEWRLLVRCGQTPGLWLLDRAVSSRAARWSARAWHIPARRTALAIEAHWSRGRCRHYAIGHPGGEARHALVLEGTRQTVLQLPGLSDPALAQSLLHESLPLFYPAPRGQGVAILERWSAPLVVQEAQLRSGSLEALLPTHIGLLPLIPLSALLCPALEVIAFWPARQIPNPCGPPPQACDEPQSPGPATTGRRYAHAHGARAHATSPLDAPPQPEGAG